MNFEQKLEISLRARCSLIVVSTYEEERVLETAKSLCYKTKRKCVTWDAADGFQNLANWTGTLPLITDPQAAFGFMENAAESDALFILRDFHDNWDDANSRRKLRNIAQKFKSVKKSILIVSHTRRLPEELKDQAVFIEFPLPTATEIEDVLNKVAFTPGVKVKLTQIGREKIINAALGLTLAQAERVFNKAYIVDGTLSDTDISLVADEKKRLIEESQALEFYSATDESIQVGGLAALKQWLRLRENAFSKEAHEYGLPAPKGVALIGIPGTGKSLTAKVIARLWKLPLIRLDVGALFGGYVGESEERARHAVRLAEAIAPCVLWIDEIEKAFAQTGGGDGGTSSRVFGTVITWMQEKTAPCFVVATANDISGLPPEFLRRGRFDEIFFLDLPTIQERREILRVHIEKRKRKPDQFELEALAMASAGYVGAEIEQAIIDAMYVSFDEKREFVTQDVLQALKNQIPLSVSQREKIAALRLWVQEGRAQPASIPDPEEKGERPLTAAKANLPSA